MVGLRAETLDCFLTSLCFCRPFSKLQRLRHTFVPGTPACIADVANTKVSLRRSVLPIRDELTALFPTLLAGGAEGMQQIEVVIDNQNGSILRSDTPLRVSLKFLKSIKF